MVRDPYAWWCGRGGAARRPPIPISGLKRAKNVVAFNRGLMSDIVESPDLQRSSCGGFGEVILGHTIVLIQEAKRPIFGARV